ncbi:MAG: hypothetical protein ACTSYM_12830, partial [Candidatus Baldrarchaeia archaeon]
MSHWVIWKNKLLQFKQWRKKRKSVFTYLTWHYLLREFMREIPEALPRKDTALDVGCGPGYYLLHLVK